MYEKYCCNNKRAGFVGEGQFWVEPCEMMPPPLSGRHTPVRGHADNEPHLTGLTSPFESTSSRASENFR